MLLAQLHERYLDSLDFAQSIVRPQQVLQQEMIELNQVFKIFILRGQSIELDLQLLPQFFQFQPVCLTVAEETAPHCGLVHQRSIERVQKGKLLFERALQG